MSAQVETAAAGEAAEDPVGAFVPGPRLRREALATGPLSGLTCGVKDLFDVAGCVTTFGSPDWARTHAAAAATAPIVQALLQQGAALAGKTRTVELAYGLTGENLWHGTPRNPAAPDRFPGGSSCGSAAGTAAGLFDLALGSDTGGSVRIPASYCGLFGIRPTHGALSLAGACPLAPSFDTPGWFARTIAVFRRVGEALLPPARPLGGPLLALAEAWDNAEPATVTALQPALARLEARFGPSLRLRGLPADLPTVYGHFRALQAEEAWATLGGWITEVAPRLSPAVAERFAFARALNPALAAAARPFRAQLQASLPRLLAGGAVLVYPTSPGPAPLLASTPAEQNAVRERTIGVTAVAGLCGLPEVTLPAGRADGAPVGLSLVAAAGSDRALIAFAAEAADALGIAG